MHFINKKNRYSTWLGETLVELNIMCSLIGKRNRLQRSYGISHLISVIYLFVFLKEKKVIVEFKNKILWPYFISITIKK